MLILKIGFSILVCDVVFVVFVVSKGIRILRLQQMAAAAIKARLVCKAASGGEQFGGN